MQLYQHREGTEVRSLAFVLSRCSILRLGTNVISEGYRATPCPTINGSLSSGLDKICLAAGCGRSLDGFAPMIGAGIDGDRVQPERSPAPPL